MAQTGTWQLEGCTIVFDGNIGIGTPVLGVIKECLCVIATTKSGTPVHDMENTIECLEVTVAGAYGAVGDKIKHTRWYNVETGIPVFVSEDFVNQENFLTVTGVTGANTQSCSESQNKLTLQPKVEHATITIPVLLSTIITQPKTESFTMKVNSGTLVVNDGTPNPIQVTAGESYTWGQGTDNYINPAALTISSLSGTADVNITWEFEP